MAKKINKEINGYKYFRTSVLLGKDENGKKKIKEFYGKTKAEAELKKEKYLKNGCVENSNLTIGTSMYNWLFTQVKLSGISGGTFDRYVQDYEQGIKDSPLEWIKLSEIKSAHVQSYYNTLSKTKSYNQILRTNKILKRFFNYAIGQDLLNKNPCVSVTIPNTVKQKYKEEKVEIEILTDKEINKILEYSYNHNRTYACVLDILATTGAREGEVLGLTNENCHDDVLDIKTTLRKVKDHDNGSYSFVLNNTKTTSSDRTIFISDRLSQKVRKAKIMQKELKLKNPDYNNYLDLLFTTEFGNPIDSRNLIRFWTNALKRLNIEHRTIHALRHTFISNCANNGMDKSILQAIVGHEQGSKITDYIYTHLDKDKVKESMLKFIK